MKVGHLAKAIAHSKAKDFKNGQFGQKIKNDKNMRKHILQEHLSCSAQKTAWNKSKYSRNETILKVGHLAKAIAHAKAKYFAKMVSLAQKLKMLKTYEKLF